MVGMGLGGSSSRGCAAPAAGTGPGSSGSTTTLPPLVDARACRSLTACGVSSRASVVATASWIVSSLRACSSCASGDAAALAFGIHDARVTNRARVRPTYSSRRASAASPSSLGGSMNVGSHTTPKVRPLLPCSVITCTASTPPSERQSDSSPPIASCTRCASQFASACTVPTPAHCARSSSSTTWSKSVARRSPSAHASMPARPFAGTPRITNARSAAPMPCVATRSPASRNACTHLSGDSSASRARRPVHRPASAPSAEARSHGRAMAASRRSTSAAAALFHTSCRSITITGMPSACSASATARP